MALFEGLSEKLQHITSRIGKKSRVTEADLKEMMREIRLALLEADVNFTVVKQLCNEIGERARGADVMASLTPGQQIVKIVHEELVRILGEGDNKLTFHSSGFTSIMLYGLQGSGKTSTAAKLARYLKSIGKKPFLVSVDTHRPAAQEQLAVLARQIDVPCFIKPEEKDAVKIAREGLERCKYLMHDVLIVDTAGRMTVDNELMDELKAIAQVVQPHEKLLIVDAMIGQEAVNIAKAFEDEIGLDGFIMTKLDGDARGGAALSIYEMTHKPIKFITTGEKVDALEQYHPDRMASRILGMGDVLSLIEKASQQMDEESAAKALERLQSNTFTLDDMLEQLEQVKNLGNIKDLLGMFPGMDSKKMQDVDVDEKQMDRTAAIIKSMTKAERSNHKLLNASRRKRIARGSGVQVSDVNKLITQYEQTMKMMKQFGGMGKKGKRGMRGLGALGKLGGLGGLGGFGGKNPFG